MALNSNRGDGKAFPRQNEAAGLPFRPFLYTVDQIAVLLNLDERTILREYLYFEGRSIGTRSKQLMVARNISPPTKDPEWRIAERELVRWMRFKGFRYYERGMISN